MNRPIKPEACGACKGKDFYWNGNWTCLSCHPCQDPAIIHAMHQERFDEEKRVLIERCRKGMTILNTVLETNQALVPEDSDPEQPAKALIHNAAMDKWSAAVRKLEVLVLELNTVYNFYDCLFLDTAPDKLARACNDRARQEKHLCWACPKNWEAELFPQASFDPVKTEPRPVVDLFGKLSK